MKEDAVRALVKALEEKEIPGNIRDEKDFEQRFVEPICVEHLERVQPKLEIAVHPWGDPKKAKAWAESKIWAAVTAWGMKHTFDLHARVPDDTWHMAVEVKLAKAKGGKSFTGDFQRMMGQCHLAKLRHDVVTGVFGYIGDLKETPTKVRDYEAELREREGIWVVVLKVG